MRLSTRLRLRHRARADAAADRPANRQRAGARTWEQAAYYYRTYTQHVRRLRRRHARQLP